MCNGPEPSEQLKKDQPRIIPVKFVQNPISGFGGDVVWRNCLRMDGRMDGRTDARTHDGQNVITKAHLVTLWQVS